MLQAAPFPRFPSFRRIAGADPFSLRSPLQSQFEMHPFRLLQYGQDAGKVRGRRAALGTQHAHQVLGRNVRAFFEILKTDRSVDIVAEYRLAGRQVTVDHAFDGLTQEGLAEIRIALRPRPDGFLEVMGKGDQYPASRDRKSTRLNSSHL